MQIHELWDELDRLDAEIAKLQSTRRAVAAELETKEAKRTVLAEAAATKRRAFVLTRSDQGDGGWSLHPPGTTDEQLAAGDGLVLASGYSDRNAITGDWLRPDASDYHEAHTTWFLLDPEKNKPSKI